MRNQRAFHLEWRDPDAGHLEHVVGAAAIGVTALRIARVFVAGASPVALERLAAFAALIPVALACRGRIHQKLADFAVRHLRAGVVDQTHVITGHRLARGAVPDVARRIGQKDVQQFGGADAVENVDAETLLPAFADKLGQRLARRGADPQTFCARLVPERLIVEHRGEQRRHAEEDAGIVLADQFEHHLRRRTLGIQDCGRADRHRKGQRIAEAIGEEQFRRREADIVLADAEHLSGVGFRRRFQIGVQMAHALRHAGGARRIEPEGRLVAMGRGGVECVVFLRKLIFERQMAVRILSRHHDMLQVRQAAEHILHHRQQRLRDEQHPRAAVHQHIGILFGGQQRVERHRHDSGADAAEKDDREIDGVEHHHGDALLAPHAEPPEQVAEPPGLHLKPAIGDLGDGIAEHHLIAAAGRHIAVQQIGHGIVSTG